MYIQKLVRIIFGVFYMQHIQYKYIKHYALLTHYMCETECYLIHVISSFSAHLSLWTAVIETKVLLTSTTRVVRNIHACVYGWVFNYIQKFFSWRSCVKGVKQVRIYYKCSCAQICYICWYVEIISIQENRNHIKLIWK